MGAPNRARNGGQPFCRALLNEVLLLRNKGETGRGYSFGCHRKFGPGLSATTCTISQHSSHHTVWIFSGLPLCRRPFWKPTIPLFPRLTAPFPRSIPALQPGNPTVFSWPRTLEKAFGAFLSVDLECGGSTPRFHSIIVSSFKRGVKPPHSKSAAKKPRVSAKLRGRF